MIRNRFHGVRVGFDCLRVDSGIKPKYALSAPPSKVSKVLKYEDFGNAVSVWVGISASGSRYECRWMWRICLETAFAE